MVDYQTWCADDRAEVCLRRVGGEVAAVLGVPPGSPVRPDPSVVLRAGSLLLARSSVVRVGPAETDPGSRIRFGVNATSRPAVDPDDGVK